MLKGSHPQISGQLGGRRRFLKAFSHHQQIGRQPEADSRNRAEVTDVFLESGIVVNQLLDFCFQALEALAELLKLGVQDFESQGRLYDFTLEAMQFMPNRRRLGHEVFTESQQGLELFHGGFGGLPKAKASSKR